MVRKAVFNCLGWCGIFVVLIVLLEQRSVNVNQFGADFWMLLKTVVFFTAFVLGPTIFFARFQPGKLTSALQLTSDWTRAVQVFSSGLLMVLFLITLLPRF